jgi:hypothetical protein
MKVSAHKFFSKALHPETRKFFDRSNTLSVTHIPGLPPVDQNARYKACPIAYFNQRCMVHSMELRDSIPKSGQLATELAILWADKLMDYDGRFHFLAVSGFYA